MNAPRQWLIPLTSLMLIVVLLIPQANLAQTAEASAIGPLEIVVQSCSNVIVRFYYDGVTAQMDYGPGQQRDKFRLLVSNRTCAGPNCVGNASEYTLAQVFQDVPSEIGYVTMSASWAPAALGNGIEVSVAQMDMTASPPVVFGPELKHFYHCADPSGWTACDRGCPGCCAGAGFGLYPGAALFQFQCTGTGVAVTSLGVPVVQASFSQIASPLATAIRTGKNQPIAYGSGVSLWALKSNELQVHLDSNPDGSKLVVSAQICGSITSPSAPPSPPVIVDPPATGGTIYVVQPGDNLFRISLRFGRSMYAIASANGITNINRIYAGQRLVIP